MKFLFALILILPLLFLSNSCVKEDLKNPRILELGIPLPDLIKKGVPIEKLYNAGASVGDLVAAGAPLNKLIVIQGISLKMILEANPKYSEVIQLHKSGLTSLEDLTQNGFGIGILMQAGYTSELEKLGLTGLLYDSFNTAYRWVKIGNQVWMADDLKIGKYPDGSNMQYIDDYNVLGFWQSDTKAYYFKDLYYTIYGVFLPFKEKGYYYTWAAANNGSPGNEISASANIQGICPEGWHLPSKVECDTLIKYVSNFFPYDTIGKSLRSISGWDKSITTGLDYFGFKALPKGYRYNKYWGNVGYESGFWTSTHTPYLDNGKYNSAYSFHITSGSAYTSSNNKVDGYCIRCLRN